MSMRTEENKQIVTRLRRNDRWVNAERLYHRYYGPSYNNIHPLTYDLIGIWCIHGKKIK